MGSDLGSKMRFDIKIYYSKVCLWAILVEFQNNNNDNDNDNDNDNNQ